MKIKTLNVNLGGKELKFKMGLLAIMMYEAVAGKMFEGKTLYEYVILMYSAIIVCNQEEKITLDEFIEALDANPEAMQEMLKHTVDYLEDRLHAAEDRTKRQ